MSESKTAGHGGRREGSGRPRMYKRAGVTVPVGASIPRDWVERLDAIAEANEVTRSSVIAHAVGRFLKRKATQ